MSSFLTAAISDQDRKLTDLNDRFMMVCLKKMLNPSQPDPNFHEKVSACQRHLSSAFDVLAPVVFKHAFHASKVAAGGSGESEEGGNAEE